MNAPSGPASLWQEARNKADGRVYYYNVQTQATQWQKPVELMAPVEVCTFAGLSLYSVRIVDNFCFFYSARWRINHGKNRLLITGENTGTTRKPSKALGICRMFTKKLLRRLKRLNLRPQRKFQFYFGGDDSDANRKTVGALRLSQAEPIRSLPIHSSESATTMVEDSVTDGAAMVRRIRMEWQQLPLC